MTLEAPTEAPANARFTLFGHTPTPACVEVEARPVGWRLRRALVALGIALVVAPVAFIVPPHIPWALGVLAAGIFVAYRRWAEQFTLHSLEGTCPRCGSVIESDADERLRAHHSISCDACHHECTLELGLA